MKKEYINPTMEVVCINNESSILIGSLTKATGGGMGYGGGSSVEGRSRESDDDDWE